MQIQLCSCECHCKHHHRHHYSFSKVFCRYCTHCRLLLGSFWHSCGISCSGFAFFPRQGWLWKHLHMLCDWRPYHRHCGHYHHITYPSWHNFCCHQHNRCHHNRTCTCVLYLAHCKCSLLDYLQSELQSRQRNLMLLFCSLLAHCTVRVQRAFLYNGVDFWAGVWYNHVN